MNALPHLMVGDLVWRRLNWDEETRGHFLIGSIAPDAYRSIPGTGFRRLHFRGRKPGQRPQDLLVDYVRPMLRTGSIEEQAFWLGWFGHLAADALWRRLLAHDMPEFWERSTSGAPDERARLRQNYSDACDSVDRDFAKLYPERIGEHAMGQLRSGLSGPATTTRLSRGRRRHLRVRRARHGGGGGGGTGAPIQGDPPGRNTAGTRPALALRAAAGPHQLDTPTGHQ